MFRISSNLPMLDNRFRMTDSDYRTSQLFKGISSSRSIGELREAPIDAAHATRLDSLGKRLETYIGNTGHMIARFREAEDHMNEALSIVHRLRELSVQGASGTYSRDDLAKSAIEVNQLLEALSSVMNAKGGDGQYLFAGDDTSTPPFLMQKGRTQGFGSETITKVAYAGDLSRSEMEITDGHSMKLNLQGNEIFWSEQQQVFGARDTEGFNVIESNRFYLDGKEISLEPGDNIQTVVRKINDSGAAVKASLDPVTGSLNLRSTVPHQIWLEPSEGTALIDLGLITDTGSTRPPANWHADATVTGANLFDQVIALRDALQEGNHEKVGGSVLGGLEKGLDSLLRNIADIGAKSKRLEISSNRLRAEAGTLADWKSQLTDLDITEAITELKMLEYTQKAAYQIAGRIFQTTLMDFLR